MKKNGASQKVGVQMVTAADGTAFTSAVTVSVTGDAGTQATGSVGSGACTHEGNGYHTYAPAQAETNYDLVAFTFTGTGAVPQTVQIYTLPATGVLAPTTAGNTLDVTATGAAGIDWGNVENKTTTNALTGTTVAATQQVDVNTIKTQAVTCGAGVTVLASVGTAATSTAQTGDNFAIVNGASGLVAIKALIGTPTDNGNGATLAGNFVDTLAYLDSIDSDVGSNFAHLQSVFGSTYTADSGTTTTFADADRTEADTNYWAGSLVKFLTGACANQTRLITGFTPGTDTITFYPAATQAIAAGVQYKIIPSGAINVAQWLGTAPATPATNGVPMVNVSQLGGTSVHATSAANWHTLFLNDGLVSGVELDTIASIDKMRRYFQLGYRKDAAIATDLAAEVAEINENRGNGGGAFANSTDALEALRDRGDAAWITIAAADVRAAVGLASANLDTQLADLPTNAELATSQGTADDATLAAIATLTTYVDTEVAAIKAKTDTISDVYHAEISLTVDEAAVTDEWTISWFKNGTRVTSGITVPTIQVVKRADGTNLIASTTPTQIASTGSYKHDATTTARTTAGEAVLVVVTATIDSASRSFSRLLSRDSTA